MNNQGLKGSSNEDELFVCYFLDTGEKVVEATVRRGPYDEARSWCRHHLNDEPRVTSVQIWDNRGGLTRIFTARRPLGA